VPLLAAKPLSEGDMVDLSTATLVPGRAIHSKLDTRAHPRMTIAFAAFLVVGLLFTVYSLYSDIEGTTAWLPLLLLALALLIALGFEFVNGFHDTANAVATVIYTNSLPPLPAVIWSGFWNFLGVMVSSGTVAFGIIALLPVELILQVGSGAGFAMVFALLTSAIIWNLGTWYLGLPVSSSHTLIGSIIGVGLANELIGAKGATSGVDWGHAVHVGESLLFSPLIGFVCAALLLLLLKFLVHVPSLYAEPQGNTPPPLWIRAILVLTCTGVSFAHGSNDGQKGMGLIMLILIGIAPTAYALNRTMDQSEVDRFQVVAAEAERALTARTAGVAAPTDSRDAVGDYLRDRRMARDTMPALAALSADIARQVREYGSFDAVPAQAVQNVRNDMYLAGEALRLMAKTGEGSFNEREEAALAEFRNFLKDATKYIPDWVKIAVAIALGLGTMVGWRRVVVTVGERIGKQHLTYGQGTSAEVVAMATIGAADLYGTPVSTTQVLSSGVAGTMAANGSGLQWGTVRNLLLAWVLTLPAAISLSGALYLLLRQVF
jgi:inorganic phosphate transporter, PiT family